MSEHDRLRKSSSRRNVLKTAGAIGVAGIAGCISGGGSGNGDTSSGGKTMTLAGAYTMEAMDELAPMMFREYKENVEEETGGEITVEFAAGGELGAGTELAQKVQQGTIEAAQFSMSNFSPFAPAVDLVNLPYFAGENQNFVNLVTDSFWQEQIHQKARDNGYFVSYYMLVDPRSLATGPSIDQAPRTPSKIEEVDLTHRIPGSDMLEQAWSLAGANASPVNWGETPQALEEGVVDSTHNAFELHPAFGFTDIINHEVLIKAVQDAQVVALNLEWYNSLSSDLQEGIEAASEATFQANLEALPEYRKNAYDVLTDAGVEFVEPSEDELGEWRDAMSYERSEWDEWKEELAGSMETFKEFEKAANTKSDFTVEPQTLPE